MTTTSIFFFNDTATTEIYTLSLHDALPILLDDDEAVAIAVGLRTAAGGSVDGIEETSIRALAKLEQVLPVRLRRDRKSTRLNSSHANISYAVFCLKKNRI